MTGQPSREGGPGAQPPAFLVLSRRDKGTTEQTPAGPVSRRERIAAEVARYGFPKVAANFRDCREKTVTLYCNNHAGEVSRAVTLYCKTRICDRCGHVRAARVRRQYEAHLRAFREPKMVTLTVRNTTTLPEGRRTLRNAWKALLRRVYARGERGRRPTVYWKDVLRAGLLVEEVTNRGRGWHVHLHVLVDAPFIPHAKLQKEWKDLTTAHRVRVDRVDPGRAMGYVLKYVQKAPRLSPERAAEYLAASYGRRLIQPFGDLFAVKAPPKEAPRCEECGRRDGWRPYPPSLHYHAMVPMALEGG